MGNLYLFHFWWISRGIGVGSFFHRALLTFGGYLYILYAYHEGVWARSVLVRKIPPRRLRTPLGVLTLSVLNG